MAVRNVSRARKRGFGGFTIFVAALNLLAAAPAAATVSSEVPLVASETIIGLSLKRISTDREALAIRGASVGSGIAEYDAVAFFRRIPCPGAYRYSLQSENQDTGAQSEYAATVSLSALGSERPASCGGDPPSRPGTLYISVSGDEETLDFAGRLGGSEGFLGDLTMGTQPVCEQRYRLSIAADLRGWNRSVRYGFRVASWKSEAMGRKLESDVC